MNSIAWEQCELNDFTNRIVRKNLNNESDLPLTISAIDGLVDQTKYFNNRVASKNLKTYFLVYNGEFAYNKSSSDGYPYGAIKRLDYYQKGVLSSLYIVFEIKKGSQNKVVDSDFLTILFDTNRWHYWVSQRAAEGARNHGLLNISPSDFFLLPVKIPYETNEQKKIGKIFFTINRLITLHQRKPP
mgnify:CR=1 FL=1